MFLDGLLGDADSIDQFFCGVLRMSFEQLEDFPPIKTYDKKYIQKL